MPTTERFHLSGIVSPDAPPGEHSDDDAAGFTLTRSTADRGPQEPFEDFFEKLATDKWPDGFGRKEQILAGEQMRVMEGGLLGFPGVGGLLVRPIEMVDLAKKLWRALSGSPPEPLETHARLRVVGRDGSAPSLIAVVPMTGWTVGELALIGCDGRGGCALPEHIARSSTLLVIHDGAALIRLDGLPQETPLELLEVGVLRMEPPTGGSRRLIRISDAESAIPVPVPRWKNRDGDEWVGVEPPGLSVQLPAGRYTVELKSVDGSISAIQTTIVAGVTTVESIP